MIQHAKASNLVRKLKNAYDECLDTFDVIVMPTTPMHASLIPDTSSKDNLTEQITRSFEMVANTSPFNATGHPAMSIPCGMVPVVSSTASHEGDRSALPVGVMIVSKHFNEERIYQVARVFETLFNEQKRN